ISSLARFAERCNVVIRISLFIRISGFVIRHSIGVHLEPSNPTTPIPPVSLGMLNYQEPQAGKRPGILTAVGVLSIVIGCLSGLQGLGGIASGAMMLVMSSMTFPMGVPPPAPAPAPAPTTMA